VAKVLEVSSPALFLVDSARNPVAVRLRAGGPRHALILDRRFGARASEGDLLFDLARMVALLRPPCSLRFGARALATLALGLRAAPDRGRSFFEHQLYRAAGHLVVMRASGPVPRLAIPGGPMKPPANHRAGALVVLGLLAGGCSLALSDSDGEPGGAEVTSEELVTNGPSGTITAQYNDSPVAEGIANLMDGKATTKYLTHHNTCWVKWKGTNALKAVSYAITSANDVPGRDPKSWTLQGSPDGTTWKQLDARSGQTFTSR